MAKRINRLGRGKPLVRSGHRSTLWDAFAGKVAARERDSNGLIACEGCQKLFLRPDLHHRLGKNSHPELYFVRSNLIWLCRGPGTNDCHAKAHSTDNRRPDLQQSQPAPAGELSRETSFNKARRGTRLRRELAVAIKSPARLPQTVYSSRGSRDDHILSKPPARFRPQLDTGHLAEGRSLSE